MIKCVAAALFSFLFSCRISFFYIFFSLFILCLSLSLVFVVVGGVFGALLPINNLSNTHINDWMNIIASPQRMLFFFFLPRCSSFNFRFCLFPCRFSRRFLDAGQNDCSMRTNVSAVRLKNSPTNLHKLVINLLNYWMLTS